VSNGPSRVATDDVFDVTVRRCTAPVVAEITNIGTPLSPPLDVGSGVDGTVSVDDDRAFPLADTQPVDRPPPRAA
jgi:hypothetical protein